MPLVPSTVYLLSSDLADFRLRLSNFNQFFYHLCDFWIQFTLIDELPHIELPESLRMPFASTCPNSAGKRKENIGKNWGICSPEISYMWMLVCACACLGASFHKSTLHTAAICYFYIYGNDFVRSQKTRCTESFQHISTSIATGINRPKINNNKNYGLEKAEKDLYV